MSKLFLFYFLFFFFSVDTAGVRTGRPPDLTGRPPGAVVGHAGLLFGCGTVLRHSGSIQWICTRAPPEAGVVQGYY